MIMSLIIFAAVLLIAYWWTHQGAFSGFMHLLCVVFAGVFTFALWEPFSYPLLATGFAPYAKGTVFLGLFTVLLLSMRLALDPLSAWFLLILGLCGIAASAFAFGHVKGPEAARRLVPYPLFLAGMALTLLAADGFTLVLGFELMSFASWVLVAHEQIGRAHV